MENLGNSGSLAFPVQRGKSPGDASPSHTHHNPNCCSQPARGNSKSDFLGTLQTYSFPSVTDRLSNTHQILQKLPKPWEWGLNIFQHTHRLLPLQISLKYAVLPLFEYAPWSPAGEAAFVRDKEQKHKESRWGKKNNKLYCSWIFKRPRETRSCTTPRGALQAQLMIIKSPAAEVNGNFALGLLPGMTVIWGKIYGKSAGRVGPWGCPVPR